jgi:ElaB/YqjD/DUF883 family membrane-anchored ribosome-binding protein
MGAQVKDTLSHVSAHLAALSAFMLFLIYSFAGATVGLSEGLLAALVKLAPEVKHTVCASSKSIFNNAAAVMQKNGKELSAKAKPYIDSGRKHVNKAVNGTTAKAHHTANNVSAKTKQAVK